MAWIYGMVDPLAPEALRYVGVTTNDPLARVREHVREALRQAPDGTWAKSSNRKRAWVRKLIRENRAPQLVVLDKVDHTVRRDVEHAWIAFCRATGSPLTNVTDGREGPENYKPSDAAKQRNSVSQKRRFADPREVERQRKLTTALWTDDDYRARVTQSIKDSWTEDHRQLISSKLKAYRADSARSAGHVQALKDAYASEAGQQRIVEISKRTRGSKNPTAKLTWQQVQEIRERYAAGGVSQTKLAVEYSVSQGTISYVTRGAGWSSS